MKIEITEEQIKHLDNCINYAIKSNSIIQLMAITMPENQFVKLEDSLEITIELSKSLELINNLKNKIDNE